jgi:hypothetical protein
MRSSTASARASSAWLDNDRFALLPVHPWQWQALQGRRCWRRGWPMARRISLGMAGDRYTASQSVRTLLNADRPSQRQRQAVHEHASTPRRCSTIEPHSVCTAPLSSRAGSATSSPAIRCSIRRYPLAILDEYAGIIAGREGPLAGQLAAIWRRSVDLYPR